MQTNDIQKVALINSTNEHTKNNAKRDRQSLVQSPFVTSGPETERVYSCNPEPARGPRYKGSDMLMCRVGL